MSRGLLFWIIMLLVLIGWVFYVYPHWWGIGGGVVLWVLLALLGWNVFGPPIKGD